MIKQIKNSKGGQVRFICSFINLVSEMEKLTITTTKERFEIAHKRAKAIGGRVYKKKGFPNYFVFTGRKSSDLISSIENIKKINYQC